MHIGILSEILSEKHKLNLDAPKFAVELSASDP